MRALLAIVSVMAVLPWSVSVFADPPAQERHFQRSNGWVWDQDTANKNTPSCLDKYGHEAGRTFVSYLGSVTDFYIGDRKIRISAGPNVPAVEGQRDFKQSGEAFWVLPQPLFFGPKWKPVFGGYEVEQLVSYEVSQNLTTLQITFLALDHSGGASTVRCDEIFWTILDVNAGG